MIYNLGKVIIQVKGNYSNTTTYTYLDMVYFNGSSYVAKQTTTANAPTNTKYWQIVALKGELSPTLTEEQTQAIISQITSSANFVQDSNYTHTDNNYTTTDKEAVANIGNGIITIKRNNSTVGTFSTNSKDNTTINITVPTRVEELGGIERFNTAPNIIITESQTIDITDIESNCIYCYTQPINSVSITNKKESDIKERYTKQATIIDFTTDSTISKVVFGEGLQWEEQKPQTLDPNTTYRINSQYGVMRLAKIINK